MKHVRGGSGFGDSIYVRAVAEHLLRQGNRVRVRSDYPEVFAGLQVDVERFVRDPSCNVIAHYSGRKEAAGTNQWQDICITAGVGEIPLAISWQITNRPLVSAIKARADGRPIIMVNGGRPPMGRTDGYGYEMLPAREAFYAAQDALRDCFMVKVGKGPELYPLAADLDLSGETTPAEAMDVAYISKGMLGQCSFMIPLAEALDKPLVVVWAAAGLTSGTQFIRLCTPQKILSKETSHFVMDDWQPEQIAEAVRGAFRQFL